MIPLAIENADRYVGGAYLVFLLLLLIYVAIMAAKLQRIQRELRGGEEQLPTTVARPITPAPTVLIVSAICVPVW